MNVLKLGSAVLLASLFGTPLFGQADRHLGLEVAFGLAHRTSNSLDLPSDGIHLGLRAIRTLLPNLRVVAGASFTRFASQDRPIFVACPIGLPCVSRIQSTIPGLGIVGVTAGLQPLVPLGPLQIRLTALGGGYWFATRGAGLPSLAPGVEGALSLALPIGTQLRVLLEGRLVHLFGAADEAGSHRQMGIGLAID